MSDKGVILTEEGFEDLRRMYHAYMRDTANMQHPQRFRRVSQGIKNNTILEGLLDADLDAPADIDTEETATLSVWRGNYQSGTWADTNEDVEVTNRDPGFSTSAGEYLAVTRMGGEWRPLVSGVNNEGTGSSCIHNLKIITVADTPYAPIASDCVIIADTDAAPGPGNITVDLTGAGVDGQEIIIKAPGVIGKAIGVTYSARVNNLGVAVQTINGGTVARVLYDATSFGGCWWSL